MTNKSLNSTVSPVFASLLSSRINTPEIGRVTNRMVNFPKETKKSNKNVKNPALTESQQHALIAQITDSRVKQFATLAHSNYLIRLANAEQTQPNNFKVDTNLFLNALLKTPALMYSQITKIAEFVGKEPHDYAMQIAQNIGLCDKKSPNYWAQKELNKFPEFLSAMSIGRRTNNTYMWVFVVGLLEGLTDLSKNTMLYYVGQKRYCVDKEVRDTLLGIGGRNYSQPTANAQSGQSKKIARAMGFIDYVKGQRNTPMVIKPFARPYFELFTGRTKNITQ